MKFEQKECCRRYRMKKKLQLEALKILNSWQLEKMSKSSRTPCEIKAALDKIVALPFNWTEKQYTYKILAMTKTEDFRKQWLHLADKFAGKVEITTSNTNFLEILIPGINKWDAVKNLASQYNIKPEEIMCIGDSSNDLPMVANAGVGVAMGNATEDIKKAAKIIVADNNHDGVAEAINSVLTAKKF